MRNPVTVFDQLDKLSHQRNGSVKVLSRQMNYMVRANGYIRSQCGQWVDIPP